MAKKFLTGLRLVNLPSDPSVGSEGELYFNTSASVAKIYKSGVWSELGAGGGSSTTVSTTEPVSPETGDAWYKNDTGEFYIYDGTYWVEVNGVISLTQEQVQDYVAPLFTSASGTNVVAIYDDVNNVINLNTSGSLISVDSIVYPDYITFDITPETSSASTGTIFWDSGDSLPAAVLNSNVTIGLGQEQVALVKNDTGSSIPKGTVVYINGAQGQRPTITLSDADTEITSSKTFGLTAETIADEAEGFVTTFGVLRGVNTLGLAEGSALWLSSTAGGYTTTVPAEPAHSVFLGYVVKAHESAGEIFVNIQNGYELTELHGVLIDSPDDNEILAYDDVSGLWKNQTAVEAGLLDTSATEQTKSGNLIIGGNLTVNGTTTTLNTENVLIEDNILTLNSNVSGSPSLNAGMEIERGTSDNVSILWNESSDKWTLTNNGTEYYPISTQNGYTYNNVITIKSYDGITDGAINLESYLNAIRLSDDDGVIITTGSGSSTFIFNNSGELEFPDASLQDTAFLGMSAYFTDNLTEGSVNLYFTNQRAVDALSSTLINYLTLSSASSTYLTQANASTTYQPIGSYLTSESDPVFTASDAYSITSASISNWNTAYSWGNHSLVGYLTSESDPIFTASDAYGINSTDILNWNLAYGWGNHASAGYALSSHNHTLDSLSNVVITGTPTDGQAIVWDTTTSKWVNETVSGGGASYPDQTGNGGKFLQTDGSSVSWQNIDFTGYLTEASASTTYQPIGSYLTSTISDQVSITNTTPSTSTSTGALVISGGLGVGDSVWIEGNLHVAGTTITENTQTVATHDNLIYLNAAFDSTITNAVYASGSITYTAENLYEAGMDIRVTGVDPSGFNISSGDLLTVASATPTQFVVIKSDPGSPYVSGGISHAKYEANPDLGFAGGYYSGGYAHAGLFRDASDGIFKFFDGYTPEPDEAVNIDTTHGSFSLADISAGGATFTGTVEMTYPNILNDASYNLRMGTGALSSASAGATWNIAIGKDALASLTTGDDNIAIGGGALNAVTTNHSNVAIGSGALYFNPGYGNIAIGTGAADQWASGNYNVVIGAYNGYAHDGLSNIIVLSDGEGNMRATYDGPFDGWTLGKISYTTWAGNTIGYQYGGTGLTSLGSAGYVLAVNATVDGLEWVEMTGGGGSSFTNSSELAALLSDETGSGSVVFSTSPTITTPAISGGTINSTSIGTTTASTGKFTSVNINGNAVIESSTGTSSATSSFDTTVYSSAEFIIYGSTSTGNYVSKVLMLARGTATPIITEYAILTQGTAPTVTITPSYSSPNAVLTVAVTSGTNIEIIATKVSI